jgi:hypothetical protein
MTLTSWQKFVPCALRAERIFAMRSIGNSSEDRNVVWVTLDCEGLRLAFGHRVGGKTGGNQVIVYGKLYFQIWIKFSYKIDWSACSIVLPFHRDSNNRFIFVCSW